MSYKIYRYNFIVNIEGDNVVRLQCCPFNQNLPFFRLSLDASAIDMDKFIRHSSGLLGKELTSIILTKSAVSKMCATIPIGPFEYDCLIFKELAKKSSIEWDIGSQRINQQTIGGEGSRAFITLENVSTIRKKSYGEIIEFRRHQLTVELRNTKVPVLDAYSKLVGEIRGIRFYDASMIGDLVVDPTIRKSLESDGLNGCLSKVDSATKYQLERYFNRYNLGNIPLCQKSAGSAWNAAFGSFDGYNL